MARLSCRQSIRRNVPWPLLQSSKPRPPRSTSKTSNICATATSRCWRPSTSPRGAGPFPAMVECHGGAWCMSDRHTEKLRHEYMASHGVVSIALDFRSGNEDPYPASVQDINYAVRWAKANARALKTRPDLDRPVGPVERRPSRHAGRHAPARSALFGDPAARRFAGPGRQRALRDHVLAGDQSAQPLPPRQARRGQRQSAGRGPSRSSAATIPTGSRKPTCPRAARRWRSSAVRSC